MKLILPFPPSTNTYWRAPNKGPLAGRHLISPAGRLYSGNVRASVVEQLRRLPVALLEPLAVEITLCPPDRRRRDLDNYNKALFDALTKAGVWQDDSQVKRMLVEWGPVEKGGRVEITINEFHPEGSAYAADSCNTNFYTSTGSRRRTGIDDEQPGNRRVNPQGA